MTESDFVTPGRDWPVTSVAEVAATVRGDHPCHVGHGWDFDGFRVWVETNAPELLSELRSYFAGFRSLPAGSLAEAQAGGPVTRVSAIETAPPNFAAGVEPTIGEHKPSVRGPKEAYFEVTDGRVVHKLRTGMWFLFGGREHLAIGPCTRNPNQVINFINNRMIQASLGAGALLGHASGVAHAVAGRDSDRPPRTLIIAGFSGMGKSTLALHMLNDRRLDFLSNDRVMIRREPGPIVEGVPKHPRINPGTILHNPALGPLLDAEERRRFLALASDELWQLEHKYDGVIETCFPGQRFVLRGQLVGLVLLNWHRGEGATVARRIDVAERRELLPALIKAPGVFYRAADGPPAPADTSERAIEDRYIEALREVAVLELAGGVDFNRGRCAALELLGL